MRRGDVYLVRKPTAGTAGDPRRQRAFVVVSRQVLVDSDYTTVICAPVYSSDSGLRTQVAVGADEGLKHESAVHCDGLVSLRKALLTNHVAGSTRQHNRLSIWPCEWRWPSKSELDPRPTHERSSLVMQLGTTYWPAGGGAHYAGNVCHGWSARRNRSQGRHTIPSTYNRSSPR